MRETGEQLPERAGIDHINIEHAVVDGGVFRHGQPAAVVTPIGDADLIDGRRPRRGVVDIEIDEKRLKGPDRPHETDRISEHLPGSLERFRLPLDHLGSDADARHVEIGLAVCQPHIDRMLAAVERDLGGLQRFDRQPDGPGEIVGGAKRQHGEGSLELEQRGQRLGQRAVAAADHDAISLRSMRLEDLLQVPLLVGDHQDGVRVIGEPLGERRQRLFSAGGIGVNDDQQFGFLDVHGMSLRQAKRWGSSLVRQRVVICRARKLSCSLSGSA